ncbi:unnamed protein product, partial [Polarella glacialis]
PGARLRTSEEASGWADISLSESQSSTPQRQDAGVHGSEKTGKKTGNEGGLWGLLTLAGCAPERCNNGVLEGCHWSDSCCQESAPTECASNRQPGCAPRGDCQEETLNFGLQAPLVVAAALANSERKQT